MMAAQAERLGVDIRLFEGPSVLAPFPAVVADFAARPVRAVTARQAEGQLRKFLAAELVERLTFPLRDGAFETMAAALAGALQDCRGLPGLEARAQRAADGRCRIVMGYLDASAAALAMRTGLEVAAGFFSFIETGWFDREALNAAIRRAAAALFASEPDPLSRALICAARRRRIPVYPVAPARRIWLYGQGSEGVQFVETASEFDAFTGAKLARDKFHSNQFITRLGLPGVRHGIARDVATASKVARELGFPVVVKPSTSNKGRGVTVDVGTEEELAAAFALARGITQGDVLVERQVAGDDHRLAVFGGKLAWAVRRSPPRLVADGAHTVTELVAMENGRRTAAPAADITAAPIALDDTALALLAKQGLKPDDRPAAGTSILLGRVANIARGATVSDCTAVVHPDNRELAETIARCFRLDAAGIDFMTPDIATSWRDVACAVLEVNSPTGFSIEARADVILEAKFPSPCDGRIPSIVLVGASQRATGRVVQIMEDAGRCVGWSDGRTTFVGGERRFSHAASVPSRVAALVLDASCEALVVAVTAAELEAHGFPLDRCDLALVCEEAGLSAPLEQLVGACAARVIRPAAPDDIDAGCQSAIADVLRARPQVMP